MNRLLPTLLVTVLSLATSLPSAAVVPENSGVCEDPNLIDVSDIGNVGITIDGTFDCRYTIEVYGEQTRESTLYEVVINVLTNPGLNIGFATLDVVIPYEVTISVGQNAYPFSATDSISIPFARTDNLTVAEDSAATSIPVLDNDADGLELVSFTQPVDGTVTRVGSELTYTPNPDFCTDDTPDIPWDNWITDVFTYTASGGRTSVYDGANPGYVEVVITCIDDPTTAVDDEVAVDEGSGATTIDVLANDSDPDGGLAVQSITQPTGGTVAITNAGADLTYTPDPGACYTGTPIDDFTYTAAGGGGADDTASVRVTVACPVVMIPTLDQWGLALLVLLLTAAGFTVLSRRNSLRGRPERP